MPGPVPKPDHMRAGHRAKSERSRKLPAGGTVKCPSPRDEWHPAARDIFDGAVESVASATYEPSDWAMLMLLCDLIDKHYTSARPSAEVFKAAMALSARLLLTTADRLRARIEAERAGGGDDETHAGVSDDILQRFAALAGDET